MASGERITSPHQLMLGDTLHFTKAVSEHNRDRDYRVETIRQDSITVSSRDLFLDERLYFTIPADQLEEFGTEIVWSRHNEQEEKHQKEGPET